MAHTANRGPAVPLGVELPERYEIRRRIANGGMASVWCAHDRALGRNVAIKLLSDPFAHDPLAVRRFKREARAAARLASHPHVVTIYDVGEVSSPEDGTRRAFLVMEYLAGGTVADALRVGAVNRSDVIRWLHQAAAALDYAHGRGVVHRDIKPVNFLLDCDRVLHVADFGIARIGTEDTIGGSREILGTAAYLAPERALGRAATEASDRYSLAVTAFELLVGERPFNAENFTIQARQHVEAERPRASRLNASLPPSVDRVLTRGLAKRPEDRWATAGAFADAIEVALSRGPARRITGMGTRVGSRAPIGARLREAAPAAAAVSGLDAAAHAAATADARATPPPLLLHDRPRTRKPRIAALLAALAAAAFIVGAVAGTGHRAPPARARASTATTSNSATNKPPPPKRKPKPHRPRPASTTTSAAAAPPTTTTASATAPPPSADTLEAQGHALMEQGSYAAAIGALRQALTAATPGSLTYAYALFDLGRSLRLAGNPQAAIPILWQRMKIPNQTEVVRQELQLALQAVGAHQRRSGGAAAAPPAPGQDHHGPRKPGHGDGAQQLFGGDNQGD